MTFRNPAGRPRLVILTDIGGDPDDQQSLVRLLVHANEFEIEGLIPEHWTHHKPSPAEQMALVERYIVAYEQVQENLLIHATGFPTAARLRDVLKRGKIDVPFALDVGTADDVSHLVGPGMDSEGSDWLIAVMDRPDPRPVNISVWGGTADLAQALWRVRAERGPQELAAFVAKIRLHTISDQDDTGPWIRQQFPSLFSILDHARDGDKWHSGYRGMFVGGDESLTSRQWIDTHVRQNHGPLGALYPPETGTGPNPHRALKESDTPSWLYFYHNGLNVPSEPSYGGWGGRFERNGTFFQDAWDTVGSLSSGQATVWRWRPAFQNEFQARMDWCIQGLVEANHKPVAVFNGDSSTDVVEVSAAAGELVQLHAMGSHDRDGNALSFKWWVYQEAGSYGGAVLIADDTSAQATLQVPLDAAGRSIHVILEVTDEGTPPLTAYRRVIVGGV